MKKSIKKSISRFFGRISKIFEEDEEQGVTLFQPEPKAIERDSPSDQEQEIEIQIIPTKNIEKIKKKKSTDKSRNKIIREPTIFVKDSRDIRDVMELMESPFVSLSKHRTEPIIYETYDEKSKLKTKLKISGHRGHYIASIYDWDIILLVASKIQEAINSKSDIPSRTLIIPRHELLKEIYKHDGKKNRKEIEASLERLQLTGIETTTNNEDYRHRRGFGFLDDWGYTERKDIKEFRITLSEWLYEIACTKGALLKVHPEYFKITSGIKRFLYRTARKHVGIQNENWTFLVETLYEKSGSEQEFKKFKYDLRKSVKENNIPGYFMDWIDKDGKSSIRFVNIRKEINKKEISSKKSP